MFNTNLPLYGIMILLSLAANILVVVFFTNKRRFSREELFGALFYENVGIVLGAKVFSYFQNPGVYEDFNILSLGMSAYGGIIGALICLFIYGLQFKKKIGQMLLIFMPPIPLMYAIGKIGCFLEGCCYGVEYSGFGSVVYMYSYSTAPAGVRLFPVQLAESIVFTCVFAYILFKINKNRFNYFSLGIAFCMGGVCKLALDFLRMSHAGQIISINQIFSIIFIVFGLYLANTHRNAAAKNGNIVNKE
jgi:phosphatidylglycerol:prolipoprotein diacylglycerol transferase